VVAAWKSVRWWQRRQGLQALATARHWRWRGMLDSGAHDPYARIARLRLAALLHNVIEGDLAGYELYLFDCSASRGRYHTSALVRLPEDPARFKAWSTNGTVKPLDFASSIALGPRLKAALAPYPRLWVETESRCLLVAAPERLEVSHIPAFLDAAVSLATALVEDTRGSAGAA
jgi:hypothetical protein